MNNQILYAIKNLEQRVVDLYSKIKNINVSSAGNLQAVTTQGSTTTNDIEFNDGAKILFDNGSRLQKGTNNSETGGNGGIAQVCSIDYELKWEAGRLYTMQQDGFTIREVSHNFTLTPGVNDDTTRGFTTDSRWILDNGNIYLCTDNTEGAAIWELIYTIPKYKVYTALLSQTDEEDPEPTVLENTLGGTVVWTRDSVGNYIGTLNGAFPADKTVCFYTHDGLIGDTGYGSLVRKDSNRVWMTFNDGTGTYIDTGGQSDSIEIRVYN